jgi:hypothetical protein
MLNLIRNTVSNFRLTKAKQDANNFLAAAGITGQVQSQAIYNLVNDLQTSGLWSKMKAVYPMVTDNRNLLSYTEDFSNAVWTKSGATVTNNDIIAPNGTLTADKVVFGAANNYIYQSASSAINTCTQSVYIKGTAGETISFDDLFTYIPLVTLTGDWQRVSWTSTNGSPHGLVISTAQGATARTVWVWGGQIELGSTLKTYQPILTTPSAFMASQMKYNLKDPRDLDAAFRLTWSGGWTYSATGATPNGTNAYADTKLVPNANFTSNNSSFSVYSRTENTNGGDVMGTTSGIANRCFMFIRYGANQSQINHNSGSVLAPTTLTSLGTFLSSRTALGHRYYVNNALSASSNLTETGLSTVSFYIGADNTSGSAANYTNRQFAFSHIGDGLTDQESFLFNQIVEKYQVALSRGVQAAQSFYYNSAYSNEANTYLYSTQITGTTQVSAINTLINGLKANNLWTKMKAVYPFVTDKWNLLGYTEDFTNAAWSKGGGTTVTANTTTAPDGTTTADTVVLPNTGTIAQSLTNTANTQTIFSIYLRASANTTIKIGFFSPGTVVTCNVTTEWQRFTITHTYSGTAYPQIYNDTGATVTLFVWGAQAEYNSSATTYQAVLGANSYASNVAAQMKFNLVNPQDTDAAFRLAFSGGWTYSTNGAQPNGTNGYADTKLVPSTNLSQNNTHIASYIRNTSQGVLLGTDNTFRLWIAPNFNGINKYAEINNGSTTTPTTPISTLIGLWTGSRINASTVKLYNNSSINYSYNILSSGLDTSAIYISARNAGGASNYSSSQVAFSSIGEGLSDAEVIILNQLITDLQTTLSRNV